MTSKTTAPNSAVINCADDAAAKMNTEYVSQPPADECADDADNDVHNNAEAAAANDTARQRAGNSANNQPENDSMRNGFHRVLRE